MAHVMEQRDPQTRNFVLATFGIGAALASMTWLFGVSPILTATITLCYIIIVLSGLGCSLHLREIELLEHAEESVHLKEHVEEQMLLIASLLESARERLDGFDRICSNAPSVPEDVRARIESAQAFIIALDHRFQQLVQLSTDTSDSALRDAGALILQPLDLHLPFAGSDDEQPDAAAKEKTEHVEPGEWSNALGALLHTIELELAQISERAA